MKAHSVGLWLAILETIAGWFDAPEKEILRRYLPGIPEEKWATIEEIEPIRGELLAVVEKLPSLTFELIALQSCGTYNTEANEKFFSAFEFATIRARLTPAVEEKTKRKKAA